MNPQNRTSRVRCRTEDTKKKLIARLRRIEGQTRALQQMIAEDRACIDILRLVSSVSGALRGVWTEVLNDHLSEKSALSRAPSPFPRCASAEKFP